MHRTTVAASLVASLAFLGACTSGGPAPSGGSAAPSSAAPAPAAKPADELGAAVLKLSGTPHRYTVKVPDADITGSTDPATKSVTIAAKTMAGSAAVSADLVAVDTDLYARITGIDLPGLDETKWLHVDGTRVTSLQMFGVGSLTDPAGVLALTSAIKDVRKTGDRTYTGTLDLTRPASGITDADIRALAEKAKNIPFEATLDGQGNLVGFTFTVPASGSERETPVAITISDHGTKVDISKPPTRDVVEAPEIVYQLLSA